MRRFSAGLVIGLLAAAGFSHAIPLGGAGVSGHKFPGQTGHDVPSTITVSANAFTVDRNDGNVQAVDLEAGTGTVTATFSNPAEGSSYILRVLQDSGGGGYDITWPGTVEWPAQTAPTITADNDAVDVISCMYLSSAYHCAFLQDFGVPP